MNGADDDNNNFRWALDLERGVSQLFFERRIEQTVPLSPRLSLHLLPGLNIYCYSFVRGGDFPVRVNSCV